MNEIVKLYKRKVKAKGKLYTYWYLRWYGVDGKRHGKCVGQVGDVSKRQAEKARQQKILEFQSRPGRRNTAGRACSLSDHLDGYYAARKSELMPKTLESHQQTGKYLLEFFGEAKRIDQITKADARDFKTALANGDLKHITKRKKELKLTSVDINIRNARTIFSFAAKDDIIAFNPFTGLSESTKATRKWHYVTPDEYQKLVDNAPPKLKLLISLCRLAGLRRGEGLSLEWVDVDFDKNRLTVIAGDTWQPKDKDSRVIPICPELLSILTEAHQNAPDGSQLVIGGKGYKHFWRDFQVLFRKSGVKPYSKPYHSLRKACITDWCQNHPMFVVREWAGHSDIATTATYYTQVSDADFDKAAVESLWVKENKTVLNLGKTGENFGENFREKEKAE